MRNYFGIFVLFLLVCYFPSTSVADTSSDILISPAGSTSSTIFVSVPEDFEIEQGLSENLVWDWDHNNADNVTYHVYKNGSIIQSQIEGNINPSKYTANKFIDGSEVVGVYNATFWIELNFINGSSHQENDTTFIEVVPEENPQFLNTPTESVDIELGTTPSYLNWTISDLSPASYTIEKNGSILSDANQTEWTQQTQVVTYSDTNVTVGNTYNYTIIFTDQIGLTAINSTIATIIENPEPELVGTSSDTIFAKSQSDKTYSWTFEDNDLLNYTVFVNSSIYQTGDMTIDTVEVDLSSLTYGKYNLTVIVQDNLNQTVSDTVFISIIDIVKPVLQSTPSNQTVTFGGSLQSLLWNATDDNNATYQVFDNGTLIYQGTWVSGQNIAITPTINQILGFHNISIEIKDGYDNEISDWVNITIVPISTHIPVLSVTSEVYVDSKEDVGGYWSTGTGINVTGGTITAILIGSDGSLKFIEGNIDINGNVELDLDYSDVPPGNYTWIIEFTKLGYQTQTIKLEIRVNQVSTTATISLDDELVQGQDYSINVSLSFDTVNRSGLQLQQLLLPEGMTTNVEIELVLSYTDNNGIQQQKSYFATTDSEGVAHFTISAADTQKIASIIDVQVLSTNNGYLISSTSSNFSVDQIRVVVNLPATEGNNILLVIIVVILLLSIAGVAGYFILNNSLKLIKPIDHLDHLQSIQMIILSNSNGIPIFEKSFADLETDSTMIAGLSSAISTFLDEFIDNEEKGLEVIERDNLSLISHRSADTVFTIVSSPKLPLSYQSQIITVHSDLISQIPVEKLQQSYSSSNDNLDTVVMDTLHHNGIRVNLLMPISFSADRFREYLNFGAPNMKGIVSRYQDLLRDLNFININLIEYFELMRLHTELSDEKITKLLFELDDLGLIDTE